MSLDEMLGGERSGALDLDARDGHPDPSFEVPGKRPRTASLRARDAGVPVPSDVATAAARSFGGPIDRVRIHTGPEADRAASSMGMQAFATGTDVYFRSGAYDPSSEDGRFVLLHELAHVAQSDGAPARIQGKLEIGESHDSAEGDADRAAEAALRGQRHTVERASGRLRGFGATAKRDSSGRIANPEEACHENQTVNAATSKDVGMSERDAKMVYSGNWQRDMNQFLIPKLAAAAPAIYEVMNILHAKHFGATIPGKDEEFGTYDPAEHLDAPGDLTDKDVFDQKGDSAGSHKTMFDAAGKKKDDKPTPLADADKRYVDAAKAIDTKNASKHLPPGSAEALTKEDMAGFRVDESAIPVYLQVARTQLKETLRKAVNLYGKERDRALRMAGEGLHTLQDYYAHSNFCEVAVNLLLDGKVKFDKKGKRTEDGSGETLVELLQLKKHDKDAGKNKLNSYVHAHGKGDVNLETAGGKEVIQTGSFSLKDTVHSFKEKVTRFIEGVNPFEKGGKGGMGKAIAIWLDSNPKYGGGLPEAARSAGKKLKAVIPIIEGLGDGITAVRTTGARVDGAVNAAGSAISELWNGGSLRDAAGKAGGELAKGEAEAQKRKKLMDDFVTKLNAKADALASGKGNACQALHDYVSAEAGNVSLAAMVKEIPVVGEQAAREVKKVEDEVREYIRSELEAAWKAATKQVIAELDAVLSQVAGDTVMDKSTHSKTMSGPTHTDIAKDFDDKDHGTHDTFSIVEEVAELYKRKGLDGVIDAAKSVSEKVNAGDFTSTEGLHKVAEAIESSIPKSEEDEPHQHQHRHGGAWLAPMASSLATRASTAVLAKFQVALGKKVEVHQPDTPLPRSLEAEVDHWFSHPADCMDTWQGEAMKFLMAQDDAGEDLRKELARRTGKPPSMQAPNDHAHDQDPSGRYDPSKVPKDPTDAPGHEGHDHDHDDDHPH